MTSRRKLHVDHDVRPAHVTAILDRLSPFVATARADLMADLAASGHSINRHYLLWNLKVMRALGLVEVDSKQDMWQLSRRGVYLRALHEWDERAFYDMMHYLYYVAWDRGDQEAAAFSWTYQTVCNLIWERRPNPIEGKALAAEVRELARREFGVDDVSITDYAIDGVYNWVRALEPPFAWTDAKKRRRETNNGRSDCSPELFLLAIDYLYGRLKTPYGQPIALDTEHTEIICRLCLLDPVKWRAMVSRTLERFPMLQRTVTPAGPQATLERAPRLIVWPGTADTEAVGLDQIGEPEPAAAEALAAGDAPDELDDEDDGDEVAVAPGRLRRER